MFTKMSRSSLIRRTFGGILGLAVFLSASGVSTAAEPADAKPDKKIVINSASRFLTLYENGEKKAMYPLGLGKTRTPTPVGYFKIQTKEINPSWISPSNPEYEIPSGPNNPLGYRWMRIKGNYGIHGTNKPESIGHYVSNGCIRLREADVEKLFDAVEIGTPVEITYQRVVIEKTPDENIAYYIYPDGYSLQKLNVAEVRKWLTPYGVAAFESDADIAQKIKESDGNPTYIGKPYNIEIDGVRVGDTEQNGQKFFSKAVVREGITYLPAVPIAINLKTKLEWRASESTLKTAYGEVTGYERGSQLYLNADDAVVLFKIDGGLKSTADKKGKIFKYHTVSLLKEAREGNNEPAPENSGEKIATPENNSTEPVKPVENTGEVKPAENALPKNATEELKADESVIPDGIPKSIEDENNSEVSENKI